MNLSRMHAHFTFLVIVLGMSTAALVETKALDSEEVHIPKSTSAIATSNAFIIDASDSDVSHRLRGSKASKSGASISANENADTCKIEGATCSLVKFPKDCCDDLVCKYNKQLKRVCLPKKTQDTCKAEGAQCSLVKIPKDCCDDMVCKTECESVIKCNTVCRQKKTQSDPETDPDTEVPSLTPTPAPKPTPTDTDTCKEEGAKCSMVKFPKDCCGDMVCRLNKQLKTVCRQKTLLIE